MSECPAFYCSRCKIPHADECPPDKYVRIVAPAPAVGLHDWEERPVVDLSNVFVCKACGLRHRQSLLDTILGTGTPRPLDGCPGKPKN